MAKAQTQTARLTRTSQAPGLRAALQHTLDTAKDTASPSEDGPHQLTARTERLLAEIRPAFGEMRDGITLLNKTARTFAPKFVAAFHAWQKDTEGTFVAFVRVMDPAVPDDRAGYRAHPSYQAAEYLRRVAVKKADRSREAAAEDNGRTSATPMEALASVTAALLQRASAEEVWEGFKRKLRWNERQITGLQAAVVEAKPLMREPRLVKKAA